MALSKEQILGSADIETKSVPIPQWGGDILLKALNGLEREELERHVEKFKRGGKISSGGAVRAVALIMSAVDENGQKLFSLDDAEELAKKSAAALDAAFDHILNMNGMSKKDAEELEKNSE